MFYRSLAAFVLLSISSLTGCAQYQWQKYGGTQGQFNRDSYECQMEAAHAYPSAIVTQQLRSGYTTPATTNCYSNGSAYGLGDNVYGSSNTSCTTTPGQKVAPVTYTVDANKRNRVETAKACLLARGYNLVRVK